MKKATAMPHRIEAVPNISEGRREDVLERLREAADSAPGAGLAHFTADASHNRSVYTLIGTPEGVAEACFRLCRKAVECIDMNLHQGEHPCVGAADVIPFVPLAEKDMPLCLALAEEFARRLGGELELPCILYALSARHEGRRRLADIRRGGFAGLAQKLRSPQWQPDAGPSLPHPRAGISAVGARKTLVAFNVNLNTGDVALAREIARAVRTSSGGLPCLQAIGIDLAHRGLAQVSMNLPDYKVTGLTEAFSAVEREARQRGVEPLSSELIGMIPAQALPSDIARLKLEDFNPQMQILPLS